MFDVLKFSVKFSSNFFVQSMEFKISGAETNEDNVIRYDIKVVYRKVVAGMLFFKLGMLNFLLISSDALF